MKKVLFPIILIGCTLITNAQVGVGTDTPQATLQINGKLTTDSKDGIIIPRITKTQLANKSTSTYEVSRGTTEPNQFGTLVFITEFASYVAGSQPSAIQVSDINSIGYYYFSDSGKWTKIDTNTNLYNTNGTLSSNRVVNMDSKSLIFSGRSTSANNDVLVFGEINENDKNPAMIIKSSRRVAFQLRDPRVSFDIYTGLAANIDSPEGILIPKMNATDLARKNLNVYQGRITNTNIYSDISGTTAQGSQEGTLVYVYPDEINGEVRHPETGSNPSISKITEVTSEGLYYYGVDDKWHPVGKGVGDSSKDAWVDDPINTRVHLGATSTGAVRPTGTEVIVTDAGRVGIGTADTIIDAGLHLVGDNDGWKDDIRIDSYSGSTSPDPNIRTYSFRGTQANPQNIQNGDNIGQYNFHGRYNGTTTFSLARIKASYKGDVTTALSDLNFSVSGATNPSLYISSAQNVGIGTNTPSGKMHIKGDATNQVPLYLENIESRNINSNLKKLLLDTSTGKVIIANSVQTSITNYKSKNVQDLTSMNRTDKKVITFSDATDKTIDYATTFEATHEAFKITSNGLYELSAFIGFNGFNELDYPNFIAINLYLDKSTDGGTTWTAITGVRNIFVGIAASTGTSVQIPTIFENLNANDLVRMSITCPPITIDGITSSFFGTATNHINLPNGQTFTKSIMIRKM